MTHDILKEKDYLHYEISNYGRHGSKSRHNLMYWEGNREYFAMGTGAASYVDRARFTRPKTVKGYYRWVDQEMDKIKLVSEEEFKRSEDSKSIAIESDHTIAQTVLMCSLRTAAGLDP